jgi:hypothetical protein
MQLGTSYMISFNDEALSAEHRDAYFLNRHFVMFELGFTPLTLLGATY